jgi:hypothetical protein
MGGIPNEGHWVGGKWCPWYTWWFIGYCIFEVGEQVRFTFKEWNYVVHKTKWSKWEGNYLEWVWTNGQVWVVVCS